MAAKKTFLVNAPSGLRLRAKPEKDSDVLAVLPFGLKITADQEREAPEGWMAVADTGFVMTAYLK